MARNLDKTKRAEPETFYMTLELPGWVRREFEKVADAHMRSMKSHGEFLILQAVREFQTSAPLSLAREALPLKAGPDTR